MPSCIPSSAVKQSLTRGHFPFRVARLQRWLETAIAHKFHRKEQLEAGCLNRMFFRTVRRQRNSNAKKMAYSHKQRDVSQRRCCPRLQARFELRPRTRGRQTHRPQRLLPKAHVRDACKLHVQGQNATPRSSFALRRCFLAARTPRKRSGQPVTLRVQAFRFCV